MFKVTSINTPIVNKFPIESTNKNEFVIKVDSVSNNNVCLPSNQRRTTSLSENNYGNLNIKNQSPTKT